MLFISNFALAARIMDEMMVFVWARAQTDPFINEKLVRIDLNFHRIPLDSMEFFSIEPRGIPLTSMESLGTT